MKIIDLTGQKFGRLTALKRAGARGSSALWLCQCDCGNLKEVTATHLRQGSVRSCGCLAREIHGKQLAAVNKSRAVHGEYQSKLHNVWGSMIQRCTNPKNAYYHLYGGRGIKVCAEWRDYVTFRDWMLANGYADGLTIDRIDPNGDYAPANCRLITLAEQQCNRRNNIKIEIDGELLTMSQIIKRYDLRGTSAYYHYHKGVPIAEIIKRCARHGKEQITWQLL